MIRRKDKTKNVKTLNFNRGKQPSHRYSETSVRRRRSEYGITPKDRSRYLSVYSYGNTEDRYSGWRDKYRNHYRKDRYSSYDSLYDTEDDYYDDNGYSSYYEDEYDTDYTDNQSYSECPTCNKRKESGRGRSFDDSKYSYRYEEFRPSNRQERNRKNKNDVQNEKSHYRHRSDMDIYAVHDTLGQKGFKYKRLNSTEPQYKYEILSETDTTDSPYKRQANKREEVKYNVYSTITNNKTVFDKKFKSHSPQRLISLTDYQDIPVLAYKKKDKTGKSDIVYLPVVMKDKDNKQLRHHRSVKTSPKYRNSSKIAEKPLEDNVQVFSAINSGKNNIFNYKTKRKFDENLDPFRANTKSINIYTVSGGPSKVFRKSVTSKNAKEVSSTTSLNPQNVTEEVRPSGSSFVHRNTGTSNEAMNTEPTGSGASLIVPVPSKSRSIVENRKSLRKSKDQNEPLSEINITKKSTGGSRSIDRNSSAGDKGEFNDNNTSYADTSRQKTQRSGVGQSPTRNQSVYDDNSLATAQQRHVSGVGGLRSDFNNSNAPLKSIIKRSVAPQNKSAIKKSFADDQKGSSNSPQYLGDNLSGLESEGQDLQANPRQSIAAPKSVARQSNVLTKSQTLSDNLKSLDIQQSKQKSLLSQSPNKSLTRQSGVTQRSQSVLDRNQEVVEDKNFPNYESTRQSGVQQRGQSFVAGDQIIGTEKKSTVKSFSNKKSLVQGNQSYVNLNRNQSEEITLQNTQKSLAKRNNEDRVSQDVAGENQITGMGDENNKTSMIRQSSAPRRSQSFGATRSQSLAKQSRSVFKTQNLADVVSKKMEAEKRNASKSMVKEGSIAQRNPSIVGREQIMETQGQTRKSTTRESSAPQRIDSFVDEKREIGRDERKSSKSMARNSSVAQRGQISQNLIDGDMQMETERQNTQKSLARQSTLAQKSGSFVDRSKVIETEEKGGQKSKARLSSVAGRGQSLINKDNMLDTEGKKSQKNLARQSSAVRKEKSLVDKNQVVSTSSPKSMARKSNVPVKGQSILVGDQIVEAERQQTQRSMIRKSLLAQGDGSFVVGDQGTGGQNIQKSNIRRNSRVPTDQNYENVQKRSLVGQQVAADDLQETNTLSKLEQRKSSVVGQKKSTRVSGSNLKQNDGTKRPSKSKSKTFMKRALSKFTKKQSEEDSSATAPMLDVIMSEDTQVKSKNVKSTSKKPTLNDTQPMSEASTGSIGQQESIAKPKKSTKSKLSKPFKSLLSRTKKSDSTKKQPSNIETTPKPTEQSDAEAMDIIYDEPIQQPFEGLGDHDYRRGSSLYSDEMDDSEKTYRPNVSNLSQMMGSYDLTYIFYFFKIAQFLVGVTIYDKLMEVFAIL